MRAQRNQIGALILCGGIVACIAFVLWSASSHLSAGKHVSSKPTPTTRVIPASQPVRVTTEFEGAYKMTIASAGENHYAIDLTNRKVNWWGLKVTGAAGRTLKFTFIGVPTKFWSDMRPVYAYGTSLSDLLLFEPDARGQSRWQFIDAVTVDEPTPAKPKATTKPKASTRPKPTTRSKPAKPMLAAQSNSITFTHTFREDAAFVALRVPYTLSYQEKYLANLPKKPGVEVITIARTPKNKLPLTLIKIGRGDPAADRENPCMFIYAREHCDEPDSSWVVHGAMKFLCGEDPEARAFRDRFTVLLIPMFDPEGFLAGRHENMYRSFNPDEPTTESKRYARWFARWVNSGRRLDAVLCLHNPEPRAYPHLTAKYMESDRQRLWDALQWRTAIEAAATPRFTFAFAAGPEWYSYRLAGWIAHYYRAMPLLYEVNSQQPTRRLDLMELQDIGRSILVGTSRWHASKQGESFRASIDVHRADRTRRAASLPGAATMPALHRERLVRQSMEDLNRNLAAGAVSSNGDRK